MINYNYHCNSPYEQCKAKRSCRHNAITNRGGSTRNKEMKVGSDAGRETLPDGEVFLSIAPIHTEDRSLSGGKWIASNDNTTFSLYIYSPSMARLARLARLPFIFLHSCGYIPMARALKRLASLVPLTCFALGYSHDIALLVRNTGKRCVPTLPQATMLRRYPKPPCFKY